MPFITVKSVNVNNFREIHPALDFWDNNAIVSISTKWMDMQEKKQGDEIKKRIVYRKTPTCIMNDGDTFSCGSNKEELAKRRLFFVGKLDIPIGRWSDSDIKAFSHDRISGSFEEVFKLVRANYMTYLDVHDPKIYDLLSCFTIYTYFYPIFNTSPVLQFYGDFGTGKSRICSLLEAMAFNPVNSSNITSATIFRVIESRRATILLDESEDLSGTPKGKEITNMLLAGTGKSGEALRQQKDSDDDFETQTFKLYSPKVIANIVGVELAPLLSRIIRVTMIAIKPDKNIADRDIEQEDLNWLMIRNQLYRLCLIRFKELIDSKDNLPDHGLSARNLGIWKGMFAIANLAGEEVWESIVKYAYENKEIIESEIANSQADSRGIVVKLLSVMNSSNLLQIRSEELMSKLMPEYYYTTLKDMAMKLSKYNLHTKNIRVGNDVYRGYILDKDYLSKLLENIR
jgi:hypothetical protein